MSPIKRCPQCNLENPPANIRCSGCGCPLLDAEGPVPLNPLPVSYPPTDGLVVSLKFASGLMVVFGLIMMIVFFSETGRAGANLPFSAVMVGFSPLVFGIFLSCVLSALARIISALDRR